MGYGKQSGFTLVELLVVIAIVGFLGVIMTMAFSAVTKTSTLASGQNMALNQVHLAGSWISRDVRNAITGTVKNTTGLCTMICSKWNGTSFSTTENETITYSISDHILTRTSKVGVKPATNVDVAKYIDATGTTFTCENVTENKYFKLTVKADYEGSVFNKVYMIKQVLTP